MIEAEKNSGWYDAAAGTLNAPVPRDRGKEHAESNN